MVKMKSFSKGLQMSDYIKWFSELSIEDVDLVGGENASLGEMYQNLTEEGIRIPNGFAVTAILNFHKLEVTF
jgi:pyruvate,water dikinase